jgi:hypothetical protein
MSFLGIMDMGYHCAYWQLESQAGNIWCSPLLLLAVIWIGDLPLVRYLEVAQFRRIGRVANGPWMQ